jgi:hypothetical protein
MKAEGCRMKNSLPFIPHPSDFILPVILPVILSLDSPPTPSVILVLNKQGLDSIVVGTPRTCPT